MKNTMRIFAAAMFALCLSMFATSIMAQSSTTGSIRGSVLDQNGAAVPGVTVVATSPNLQGEKTVVTDSDGRYSMGNLPPGTYTVTVASGNGFNEFKREGVIVSLSRVSDVDANLQVSGGSNVVDVTSSNTIDTTGNTSGTNVSSEQFSNFPTQRTVQSLYSIAPTVSRSGLRDASGRDRDPSVGGSSGPENNYILDGVNTTDPAFGGSGANLPFEFVQEVEIKTGAYGAEYGKSTGGIFNVITKSGSNEFSGDAFGYFTTQGLVRSTKQFPFVGSAPNGFSEIDAGIDVGGPIKKDKLWFFGAFNPQQRKNYFLTQTFHAPVNNKISTPFYSGKVTWAVNQNNTLTFSTFGDFTKQEGFLFGNSGFGADPNSFLGEVQTGGHNYTVRANSTITPNMIGEFSFGLHFQRANTIPLASVATTPLVTDAFALLRANGTVVTPTETIATTSQTVTLGGVPTVVSLGQVAFVQGPAGSTLQRGFVRQGFGLFTEQDRNRWEFNARLQNIWGRHTIKYGFEYNNNSYDINTLSSGPTQTFGTQGLTQNGGAGNNTVNGFRVTNNFVLCTIRVITAVNTAVCASGAGTSRLQAAITAGVGPAGVAAVVTANGGTVPNLTVSEVNNNPILVRSSTRVRDFELNAKTSTRVESFYVQDDFKLTRNITLNGGMRWDYQQALGNEGQNYLSLNSFKDNLQPRVGIVWDFTGKGKGKLYLNYARFLETPLPLDINVRAGSENSQTDKNFNVTRINAPAGSLQTPGISGDTSVGAVNLGAEPTPIDPGLKPQTVNEVRGGFEYELYSNLTIGVAGVYRAQGSVIEDGSFDDGDHYFLFNPGESLTNSLSCQPAPVGVGQCFGRARRYYRALEVTATKRFTNNWQFIGSYVYSSLTGNYEGLFRNDNGQADPNITSLFDLVSLLDNSYGRLPNDRPHQLKFDGSYRFPFKLLVGASFRAQSGIPFNRLIPHPIYGNNEGFGVPRGTAIVPLVTSTIAGFPNVVDSIGSTRTPTTWNLDLNAYFPVKFGEKKELRFMADWFNVFNNQRAIRLDETFQINSGVTGVPPVTNPFYGAGTIFQFPSSLRLGVKFSF